LYNKFVIQNEKPIQAQADANLKILNELKGVLDKAITDSKVDPKDTTKTAAVATAQTNYDNQKGLSLQTTKQLNDLKALVIVDKLNYTQLILESRIPDENNV